MRIRVMASRHSAFYSPLLICVRRLREEGHEVPYGVLAPGQKTYELLRDGEVDVVQSAVSSNWRLMDRGIAPLPVHFAQINCRDGFFLAGREADPAFSWRKLEGRTVAADFGEQPLAMLEFAARQNGVEWERVRLAREGEAEYAHQQAPVVGREIVASVGASMPRVAFSSLCCGREFVKSAEYAHFRETFARAKAWARDSDAGSVADTIGEFFPGVGREAVAEAVRRYQTLGNWEGGLEIPRDLYEQALDVFVAAGKIAARRPYEDVVGG